MTENTLSLKFWKEILEFIIDGKPDEMIENPALVFARNAKAGGFDSISDEEYNALLAECENQSKLWRSLPHRAASDILLDALEFVRINDVPRHRLAQVLSRCKIKDEALADGKDTGKTDADAAGSAADKTESADAGKNSGKAGTAEGKGPAQTGKNSAGTAAGAARLMTERMSFDQIHKARAGKYDFLEMLDEMRPDPEMFDWSPKSIYENLSSRILGQAEAKKAASMVVYNHVEGRRSNTVFCGPTGSGKSEIWRQLSHEYPRLIRMVDASRLSADGWKGSLHLRDIFDGISAGDIRNYGLIVVLDEADKIICETMTSSNGTDYSAITQNSLLKMLDGDVIEFGSDDNRVKAFSVDCSRVSVVILGAFEKLLSAKNRRAAGIGFGAGIKKEYNYGNSRITAEDLIEAGMRREIAGRINRIAMLTPLSASEFESILTGPLLRDLEQLGRCRIDIDESSVRLLAEEAESSGLGVRYMRSRVMNALDDLVFEDPGAREYRIRLA